mgnify:CR=1 FL=1
MDTGIFVNKSDIKSEIHTSDELKQTTLSKNEILKSIPNNHFKKADDIMAKTNIEWRWRIFKFPNKTNEVIEISFKKPNEDRKYINKFGEWVVRNISSKYDKYVIDEYYAYSQ